MTHLTPHARQALESLVSKHIAYVSGYEMAKEELRRELEERTASLRLERDIALRLADEAGVPRTKLGKAIGTSNYKTVQDILASTVDVIHTETVSTSTPDTRWSVIPAEDGCFTITINNMGVGSVTGSALVRFDDGDLVFVDGDEFVIPQIYRNSLADAVIGYIRNA